MFFKKSCLYVPKDPDMSEESGISPIQSYDRLGWDFSTINPALGSGLDSYGV